MNLNGVRENYDYHSGKASELTRQLGFAGIALIWLFKIDGAHDKLIPSELLTPAILIVVSLALDLLHYAAGSLVWGIYGRYLERKGTQSEEEIEAPRQINWPAIFLFWTKLSAVIVGYWYLLTYLWSRVS